MAVQFSGRGASCQQTVRKNPREFATRLDWEPAREILRDARFGDGEAPVQRCSGALAFVAMCCGVEGSGQLRKSPTRPLDPRSPSPGCIHAACSDAPGRGMPHGMSRPNRPACLGILPLWRSLPRSSARRPPTILGPRTAAEMTHGRVERAWTCGQVNGSPASDRLPGERRTSMNAQSAAGERDPSPATGRVGGAIQMAERLGGLLKYYHRAATRILGRVFRRHRRHDLQCLDPCHGLRV